jgi:hypothetical protein
MGETEITGYFGRGRPRCNKGKGGRGERGKTENGKFDGRMGNGRLRCRRQVFLNMIPWIAS